MRDAGIDPQAWLIRPDFGPALASVVQRLLQTADALYARAEKGVATLPRDCRPAIQAARLVYAEIGREIQAAGLDSVNRRAVVSGRRKLVLLARASTAALLAPSARGASPPALPCIAFLVEAAQSHDLPRRTFYERTVRVIQIFERVAHRRLAMTSPRAQQPWAGAD